MDRAAALQAIARLDDYLGRASRSMDDHDRMIADCNLAAETLNQSKHELEMLQSRLQAGATGVELQDLNMNLSRIQAQMARTTQHGNVPAPFNVVDLDTLLK